MGRRRLHLPLGLLALACSARAAREHVRVARKLRRPAADPRGLPGGELLPNSPQPPPGSLEALLDANRAAGLTIDDGTLLKGDGERMDLEENVYAVAQAIRGPRPVIPL